MIATLKRACLAMIGLHPAPHPEPFIRDLKDANYRVCQRNGAWHWYRPGAFSGPYTTERAAWCAAEADYHNYLMRGQA